MTTYEEKRSQLVRRAEKLLSFVQSDFTHTMHVQSLEDLLEDLKADGQMITVLGEFKRGKSSLINALLGEALLPADVTPTTATINVIQHNLDEKMVIHYQDGSVVNKDLSPSLLKNFTFEEGEDLTAIHHIDIHRPLSQFSEQTILVDTPGVGDLNEHRIDVTYSHIPRSNLIVFVFDATAPIRKTELDYLKDTVLKLRFGEVVFVANFIDRLDEDELEETLEYMERRLNRVMKDEPFSLFPVSSKEALEEPALDEFQDFVSFLRERIDHGAASEKKLHFYQARLEALFQLVEGEMQALVQVKEASVAELQLAKEEAVKFKSDSEKHQKTLKMYISNREEEILQIVQKSVNHFGEEVVEMIENEIFMYEGGKFKNFVEKRIPIIVNTQVKNWMTAYAPHIDLLIEKLEQEIVRGFANLFEKELGSLNNYHTSFQLDKIHFASNLDVKASKATLWSGSVAAGATVLATIATGGLLIPAVTLLGYPILREKFSDHVLEKQKREVTPRILEEVNQTVVELNNRVQKYILKRIDDLEEMAIDQFNSYVASHEYNLQLEWDLRKQELAADQPTLPLDEFIALKGTNV